MYVIYPMSCDLVTNGIKQSSGVSKFSIAFSTRFL